MSRPRPERPTLLPSVRRLWRGSNQLQLGTDPGRAVILDLTDPACARVLDLLDGSRTEQALLRETTKWAIPVETVRSMIGHLRQAGYVVDAHAIRPAGRSIDPVNRRRLEHEAAALALRSAPRSADLGTPAARMRKRLRARVMITGSDALAAPIAQALADSGVGHLDQRSLQPRRAPEADGTRGPARASFAVLAGFTAPAALTALSYRRLAHLAVSVRDATVVVGPLVRPGTTPCLNCLDLHRVDRDPGWRMVAAQLADTLDTGPIERTTLLAAAAFAAREVLTQLEGGSPRTLGATVEIATPGDTIRRRWTPHPACGCLRRQRTRRTEPPARLT